MRQRNVKTTLYGIKNLWEKTYKKIIKKLGNTNGSKNKRKNKNF